MTKRSAAISLGLSIGLLLLAWLSVCLVSVRASNRYRDQLQRLVDEVIRLNDPIVASFAVGQAPGDVQLRASRDGVRDVLVKLETLGDPPRGLDRAHTSALEAAREFERAFAMLESELEAGNEMPYTEGFLETAHRGGEAVHRASAALAVVSDPGLCFVVGDGLLASGPAR